MKIITISDSPTLYSGLARVHRHVIDGLVEAGHSVLPCGWNAYDEEQLENAKKGKVEGVTSEIVLDEARKHANKIKLSKKEIERNILKSLTVYTAPVTIDEKYNKIV